MSRLRCTRACNEDGSVTVQASTMLMDDYVSASDIEGATDLISVQESDGSYSLLYIGATSNVMLLRQDETSDTGWTEEPLPIGPPAGQLAAAVDGGGNLVVFTVGPNLAQPDIYTATRTAGGWSPWTLIALDVNVPLYAQAATIAAVAVGGKVGLWTILGPSPGARAIPALWQVEWNQEAPAWTWLAQTDQVILEPCTIAGSGLSLLFANTAAATPVDLDLFTLPIGSGGQAPLTLARTVSLTTLAVGPQPDGNSAIFIADDGYLSGVRQIQYLNGAEAAAGFVTVDTAITAGTLLVAGGTATPLTLFALDADGVLNLIADPTVATQGDDFNFSVKMTVATAVTNSQGGAELVGMVPGKGLVRFLAEPLEDVDEGVGWSESLVAYEPVNTTLTQVSTYATTLTFYDAAGVQIAGQSVELRASLVAAATIGGEAALLGPAQPVTVNTDGRGQVRVTIPTDSLGAPVLSATLPGLMPPGEDFGVSPDANVKNRLAAITVDDVSKFINPSYSDPKTVAAVQQWVQETMTAIGGQPFPTVRYRKEPRPDLKTLLPGGRGRSYSLRVKDGKAAFTLLTPEQAKAQIDRIAGSAEGVVDWFENAAEAVAQAVAQAVAAQEHWSWDLYVDAEKGIEAGFTFIYGAVNVAWTGTVETIEDAFGLVDLVFDGVGTLFDRVYDFYGWLLTDSASDIWATAQYFNNLLNQGYVDLAGYAARGATAAGGFFPELETKLQGLFAKIEEDLGVYDGNQAIDARPTGPSGGGSTFIEIIEDLAAVAGWLFDKAMNAVALGPSFDIPVSLIDAASKLVTKIVSTFGEEVGILAAAFVERLKTLATTTADFGNVLLKIILDDLRDFLMAVLKLINTIVVSVLEFFADNLGTIAAKFIGARIRNGLLQAIYDRVNPGSSQPLTLQSLGCLVFAFTTTILAKAITGEVPTPPALEGGASGSTDSALLWAGLIQASVWDTFDVMADTLGMLELPMPHWANLAFGIGGPLLMTILQTPSEDNSHNAAKWCAWFSGFAPIACNLIWSLPTPEGVPQEGMRATLQGSVILAGCGLLTLGTNIWSAAANSADAAGWISGLLSPLSAIGKPSRFFIKEPDTAIAVMLVTDFTSNFGGGIAKMCKAQNSPILNDPKLLRPAAPRL